jgi:2-methylcitrate dehydratase PrpD
MSGFTAALLAHIARLREAPLSPSAEAAARMFVRDSLGVAIAGAAQPDSRRLQALWADPRRPEARVWGTALRAPRDAAAMLNAFAIHNQEFDCVHEPAVVHPMAVVLGALLTDADARGAVRGAQLLHAVVLAVEVAALVGRCARAPMRFFRPGMCGALGATAGLAALRGLDAAKLRHALGLAYSQLSGTLQAHVEGLSTLALQIGFNARAALTAVDLAAAGLPGPADFLEGRYGYFALIEGEAPAGWDDTAALAAMADAARAIEQVSHKPFPTGRAAHGALDMLGGLLADPGFDVDAVEQVELSAPPLIHRLVGRPLLDPMPASYARLCLPYLVSTCLERGRVGLDDFTPDALADPRRRRFADRVRLRDDGNADPNALAPQALRVILRDGRILAAGRSAILGAPGARLDAAAQDAKFAHCLDHAAPSFAPAARARLDARLAALHALDDVRALCEATHPIDDRDETTA